ncbi:MAG: four helix bundle protein [Saprospiraceae bacterium]|nr:four helix bundle protein [Saprospiraceae bacterium]MCB9322123.1 four helix bundle protein [Lewinellaceae bacterium]
MGKYIELKDLEIYKLSRELSSGIWQIYCEMKWQDQKIMGDQAVRSADSVGANIAEGYGRYHKLDKIRFYLIARASLNEFSIHWVELLHERKILNIDVFNDLKSCSKKLEIKLNNFITRIRKSDNL